MSQLIQSVYITFSDGRIGVFSGPAIINLNEKLTITNIKFGYPRKLPDEYSLEEIKCLEQGVIDPKENE